VETGTLGVSGSWLLTHPGAGPSACLAGANSQIISSQILGGHHKKSVVGAERFSGNAAITVLEAGAQQTASTGAFSTDAILFGKWRD
jgi:hypothetical protein